VAFAVFAFVTSVTPRPNNLMMLFVELGVGRALLASPLLASAIRYAGVAYMLGLAYRIATSGPVGTGQR
jgi:threonine/homoserine/homoserine lactone efflux protein